ncbi:unnamed protein product [Linum tenue]|uniref:F-box domain-containing protein n=2 Tax=Linum tenue TaxID=586396 RepID=A0AAV0Q9D1_9ROSI|nr:unnamed protein product [Linum tenue]CAI0541840.1 unnamed protein product [Linum tenue]
MAADPFDRLPDELLHAVFTKVGESDAKSLLRCLAVCRRFASLAVQTNSVTLSLPPLNPTPSSSSNLFFSFLRKLIAAVAKPSRDLLHRRRIHRHDCSKSNGEPPAPVSYHSPAHLLCSFPELKSLHLRLPSDDSDVGGGCGAEGDPILKWNAEFGSQIKSCVILGATSFRRTINSQSRVGERTGEQQEEEERDTQGTLSDDNLKLRIMWTISCLLAASARHSLVKKLLAGGKNQHSALENVILSDVTKQGKVTMGKDEILELRDSVSSSSMNVGDNDSSNSTMGRSRVPDLKLRMWYLPELEMKETGYSMTGATLIEIRPAGAGDGEGRGDGLKLVGDVNGDGDDDGEVSKACGEAVREMMKMKRCYVITMNSF